MRLTEITEERKLGKQYVAPQGNTHVVIFRAVTPGTTFEPMSYVTLNPRFAKDHAVSMANTEEEQYVVIRKMVPVTDVYEAYNPGEYFYNGPEIEGKVVFTANVGDDFYWQDQ